MANVDGSWDCVVKSPLGDQKMTLTVNSRSEERRVGKECPV